jgi:ferredoxin-NADP reductase/DMSO/TMAO reductase YedYZ molybdopterin-dependent catalytic subunit
MSVIARGFHGRGLPPEFARRVPPGQYLTPGFPVLSAGPTPHTAAQNWTFTIRHHGITVRSWSLSELMSLSAQKVTADIHCVTRWSKLDTRWRGVSIDDLLPAGIDARYAMAFCDGGYTTNLPLRDITGGKAWLAFEYDGQPLGPEHGGPVRLLVPHLYFWKSAKWIRGLDLRREDQPGFWESLGYHMRGDPWHEERYAGAPWQLATVTDIRDETPTVRSITFDVPGWPGHQAGQHVDLRLTAASGHCAEREYSIASAPGEPVEITVQRTTGGEVSPYLTEELRRGDQIEVRGPAGGSFVWTGEEGDAPVFLAAGGSGIVPLRSMLRHHSRIGSSAPVRLLYSARTPEDLIYRRELDPIGVNYTLTRRWPPDWTGRTGRVTRQMLSEVAWSAGSSPLAFVCGPTPFVEAVANDLVALGYPESGVKTERFGSL